MIRNATSHGDHLESALSLMAHQTYKDTQHARWWIDFHSASVGDRITRGHGSVTFDEGVNGGCFMIGGSAENFATIHDCICKIAQNLALDTVSITTQAIILRIIIASVIACFLTPLGSVFCGGGDALIAAIIRALPMV